MQPLKALIILLSLLAPIAAQIPQGYAAATFFKSATAGSAPGGILVFPMTSPGQWAWLSNVGSELTGAGTAGVQQGAGCILVRTDDGSLLAGEHAPAGHLVDIHHLTLAGSAVAGDRRFSLGTSTGVGSVDQMAWLPDGRVLFDVRGIAAGVFATNRLGILDLAAGTTIPVPATGLSGTVNALTIDSAGASAFVGCFDTPAPGQSTLFRVSLPNGGPAVPVATVSGSILNLGRRSDGHLLAGFSQSISPGFFSVDPATGAVTPLHPTVTGVNALAYHAPTGETWFAGGDFSGLCGILRLDSAGNLTTEIPCAPSGTVGVMSGLDLHADPVAYGPATTTLDAASFALAPNPGGMPALGNSGFSLTVTSLLGSDPGLLALAAAPALNSTPGFTLNIDLASILFLIPLPAATATTVPLPIPADPALAGITVYAQAAFGGLSGIAASPGLKITIL